MNCIEKRSIFNLFKVYSCKDCQYILKDEYMLIGYNSISIYYLTDNCPRFVTPKELIIFKNHKANRIFNKLIKLQDISYIIWVDKETSRHFNYEYLDSILEENLNVEIIVD